MAESFPTQVVTAWIGNNQLVATKCVLQVTDQHFDLATRIPTHAPAEIEESVVNRDESLVIPPLREDEKAPDIPGLSGQFTSLTGSHQLGDISSVPRRGAEQSQDLRGNSMVVGQGDSQSDSLGGVSDPRLAWLIEVWPALADEVKGEMLTLAGLERITRTSSALWRR